MCKPRVMEKTVNSGGRIFKDASHMQFKVSIRIIPQGKNKGNVKTTKAEPSKCELHTM